MRVSKLMVGLVLGACLTGFSVMAVAQKDTMGKPDTANGEAMSRLNHMAKELNLTDDQKAKIKPLLESEVGDLKGLKADTSMTPQQKKAKAMEVHDKYAPQIQAILTPEQQEKWKAMKQEMMEKHKGEMGGSMEHQ
jgi:Spy/CpxP family protein refolding chaperone